MAANKSVIFAAVPTGTPVPGRDLVLEDRPLDLSKPPAGGLIYKVNYISYDPYMVTRLRPAHVKSYIPAFDLGQPISNFGIVTVVASDVDKHKAGDRLLLSAASLAEYGVLTADAVDSARPFDWNTKIDPRFYLGALGMPGLTAYASLHEIGKPKAGETIFVSSAAGAVGQIVCQIAKARGLRVLGSAGSEEKVNFLKNLGVDAVWNYKTTTAKEALTQHAPDGIDIYFDNVGGEQLEDAIDAMRDFGRIVACGMISQYNIRPTPENPRPWYGIRNLMNVVTKRLLFQGFIILDENISKTWAGAFSKDVEQWLVDGTFKYQVNPTNGIDNAISGFLQMLAGNELTGKTLLVLDPLPGWENK